MATEVIHEHGADTSSSGTGLILGLIILLVLAFLLFYYGLPALRGASSGPSVNVPGQIDVNVNGPQGQGQ
jgi:hypothetical protein